MNELTNQDLLMLKIAEYELCMSSIRTAAKILAKSRRETTSGSQTLVLTGDLNELERRVNDSLRIKWPVLPEDQPDAQAKETSHGSV